MSIVHGLENFANWMREHIDSYVLIGGSACSILFDQNNENFRATNDLDIVVISDKADYKFAQAFWEYIKRGDYHCGSRNDGSIKYYRFSLPEEKSGSGFPSMIELFSKHPSFILTHDESTIVPLPFDEDISSLSAIMLDNAYYDFLCSGIIKQDNIPLLDTLHLIPLKMKAHIDLNNRHNAGEHVNDKDLRKHRSDVLKLAGFLLPGARLKLVSSMALDARMFFEDLDKFAEKLTRQKEVREASEVSIQLQEVYL